eukprot:6932454-Prymnesium_polylepis.1
MLEVGRAARRERARVGVLGARVGIVGHLRALDVAPRPHLPSRGHGSRMRGVGSHPEEVRVKG